MGVSLSLEARQAVAGRRRGRVRLLVATAALFVASFFVSAGYGAVTITPGQILSILAAQGGVSLPWGFTSAEETVFLAIRLPRVCLGALAGGVLAACGASLQGLFRNPLADPALIGVSSGAALAAVACIVLGSGGVLAHVGPDYRLPVAAFLGGLAAVWLVNRMATRNGHTDIATMLLAGVAINAICGAGIGAFVFASDDQQLRQLNFWMLGSLGGVTWAKLLPVAVLALPALLLLPAFARFLDAMLLGESETLYLGFEVERTKKAIIVFAAVAAGASVSATGIIGFIGLVVPHVIRLLAGPGHGALLPASIMAGAALMLTADIFARTLVLPAELPIGILTACVGGPFFIWLLVRRVGGGGWS